MPFTPKKEGGFLLNDGTKIPVIGIGTWDAKGEDLYEAIKIAIDSGYTHIDTAYVYQNEEEIGAAIAEKINENIIERDSIYVVSKLWNTFHNPDMVRKAVEKSLTNLQLDYLDLYLMHSPMAFQEKETNLFPYNDDNELIESNVDFVSTWKAMENLVEDGLVRSIGVSNFNITQMVRLLKYAKMVPAVLQNECHPFLTQFELSEYCQMHGIHFTAYSPLGSPNRPNVFTGEPNLFANKTIVGLAKRLNKTQAQIMIRYQIQRGHSTVPKSITPKRIRSNIDIFDFYLSPDDMAMLDGLNYNRRFVPMLSCISFKEYPFKEEIDKNLSKK